MTANTLLSWGLSKEECTFVTPSQFSPYTPSEWFKHSDLYNNVAEIAAWLLISDPTQAYQKILQHLTELWIHLNWLTWHADIEGNYDALYALWNLLSAALNSWQSLPDNIDIHVIVDNIHQSFEWVTFSWTQIDQFRQVLPILYINYARFLHLIWDDFGAVKWYKITQEATYKLKTMHFCFLAVLESVYLEEVPTSHDLRVWFLEKLKQKIAYCQSAATYMAELIYTKDLWHNVSAVGQKLLNKYRILEVYGKMIDIWCQAGMYWESTESIQATTRKNTSNLVLNWTKDSLVKELCTISAQIDQLKWEYVHNMRDRTLYSERPDAIWIWIIEKLLLDILLQMYPRPIQDESIIPTELRKYLRMTYWLPPIKQPLESRGDSTVLWVNTLMEQWTAIVWMDIFLSLYSYWLLRVWTWIRDDELLHRMYFRIWRALAGFDIKRQAESISHFFRWNTSFTWHAWTTIRNFSRLMNTHPSARNNLWRFFSNHISHSNEDAIVFLDRYFWFWNWVVIVNQFQLFGMKEIDFISQPAFKVHSYRLWQSFDIHIKDNKNLPYTEGLPEAIIPLLITVFETAFLPALIHDHSAVDRSMLRVVLGAVMASSIPESEKTLILQLLHRINVNLWAIDRLESPVYWVSLSDSSSRQIPDSPLEDTLSQETDSQTHRE